MDTWPIRFLGKNKNNKLCIESVFSILIIQGCYTYDLNTMFNGTLYVLHARVAV
jgi:hypothetical protein